MKDCLNRTVSELCELYGNYGYTKYKMNKFEEYDLYVSNKDFLISDNVITFTDTNGKLMALKPDVTLSIIKNSKDIPDSVQKVYYDENVYRVAKGTNQFKEIKQLGIECFGDVDDYCVTEIISLAIESLKSISSEYVLDISHMIILSDILGECDISAGVKNGILQCISRKNIHEMTGICERNGVEASVKEKLKILCSTYGRPKDVLPVLKKIAPSSQGVNQLEMIAECFGDSNISVDFSVVNDIHYYNGIIFKGFINGIPDSVLTGGQYDNLSVRLKKQSRAVGFAIYIDALEGLFSAESEFDTDTLILYDEKCDTVKLNKIVREAHLSGKSITVTKKAPEKIRCRNTLDLRKEAAK